MILKGKLYLVPTPIGNLEDITFRAVRILKEADLILAEDTRTSAPLLKHFDIHQKVFSHHQHNEHQSSNEIIRFLLEGKKHSFDLRCRNACDIRPRLLLGEGSIKKWHCGGVPARCYGVCARTGELGFSNRSILL